MGHLIVEQVVTADGYAADPDGGIGFFEALIQPGENGEAELNDAEQLAYVSRADAILLGATTYRMFADYWPKADPAVEHVAELIERLPKLVVSNTLTEAPWGDGRIEILSGDGAAQTAALKQRFDTIIVWGSLVLTDALFAAGLVDELHLRIVPVLLGDGRSFTPPALGDRTLSLDRVAERPGGVVSVRYRVR
ncbi:dihydrofolate reductase family protein [Agromyces endophyticus]|uniref:dihydrofolate reductase family protein n=1 Tax=Agromyces sp. H17E-10 TaxID=2932244 RepID=UPI001FD5A5DD|nr:dihydrofolate reductase family protein [Agromyces sp. H17E-10]UOQ87666.1 dihydrofolate reductase family protein [Agromyces sp. H17E-10]